MQIHELNRSRCTNEGVMDVVKGVGGAAKTALATAAGIDPNAGAASAGILDPKQKLAAVMKNPDMVKLATQYADEWLTDKRSQVSAAPAAAPATAPAAAPAPAAKLTAQQQADKKAELLGKRGAGKTTATQTGSGFKDYVGGSQNKLITNPDGSTSMKKLQRESTYYNFDYILESIINVNEKAAVATPPVTKPAPTTVNAQGFNYDNVMKMKGMEKYAKPSGGTQPPAQPLAGQTTPGQPPAGQTTPGQPPAGQTTPGQPPAKQAQPPAGQAQPAAGAQSPADPEYIKNFLEFANQKTAMRDSTTYRTLGLVNAEGSELGPELDAAKEKVKAAQGNPATTKTAVKNYILIAMAALQLVASQNAVKAASTQAPAYGQQGNTPPGATKPAAGQASANAQAQPIDVNALMNAAGLAPGALKKAGPIIQKATGNGNLSATGDDAIDGMLQLMGYNVS